MRPPAVQDLVAEAKQALLRHNFAAARQLLTEAIALHQSYKVGVESKPEPLGALADAWTALLQHSSKPHAAVILLLVTAAPPACCSVSLPGGL